MLHPNARLSFFEGMLLEEFAADGAQTAAVFVFRPRCKYRPDALFVQQFSLLNLLFITSFAIFDGMLSQCSAANFALLMGEDGGDDFATSTGRSSGAIQFVYAGPSLRGRVLFPRLGANGAITDDRSKICHSLCRIRISDI